MAAEAAQQWVDAFKRGWELDDREEWFRHFEQLVAPDVRLVQPVLPEAQGPTAVRDTFGPIFGLFPDLRVELTSWSASGDELFIAFTMSGTATSGRAATWRAVDRVLLDAQGRATMRESFFDPTPVLQAAMPAE